MEEILPGNYHDMKVMLVIPTNGYTFEYPAFVSNADFPLGFAYLASYLKKSGFSVHGVNPNNKPGFANAREMLRDCLVRSIQKVEPNLIGVGGLCTEYQFLKDAMAIIRETAPHIPVVMGGGIINNDAEFIFNLLKPDFCVIGEGEEVLAHLAAAIKMGKKNFDHIPNLGYWENGIAKFTKENFDYIDIDKLPFPDYEPFEMENMVQYGLATRYPARFSRLEPRLMGIIAARNCPFNCTFCVHQKGHKYRARSIGNILEEIKFLHDKYPFNLLYILDELFAANKSRLREFSEALIEAKKKYGWDFDWQFQTHASSALDVETLTLAKKAGCCFFSYGLESASPRVLESMNKRAKPSQFIEAIRIAKEVQVGFGGLFIFGDVAETPDTFLETMEFFHRYCIDVHVSPSFLKAFPGSKIYDYALEKGIIKDKLKYYEMIDKLDWMNINLTQLPYPVWFLWFCGLKFFILLNPWQKFVETTSCRQILEMEDHPLVRGRNVGVYEIEVTCPYCKKVVKTRELLKKPQTTPPNLRIRLKSQLQQSRYVYFLLFLFYRLLSLWRPFHNLFSFFTFTKKIPTLPTVITGCPNCNSRLKIAVRHEGSGM